MLWTCLLVVVGLVVHFLGLRSLPLYVVLCPGLDCLLLLFNAGFCLLACCCIARFLAGGLFLFFLSPACCQVLSFLFPFVRDHTRPVVLRFFLCSLFLLRLFNK